MAARLSDRESHEQLAVVAVLNQRSTSWRCNCKVRRSVRFCPSAASVIPTTLVYRSDQKCLRISSFADASFGQLMGSSHSQVPTFIGSLHVEMLRIAGTAKRRTARTQKCLGFGISCLILCCCLNSRDSYSDFVVAANNLVGKSRCVDVDTKKWLTNRRAEESPTVERKSFWRRARDWLTDAENRKRFASMGTAGVLSYGVVSNVNYIPLFSYAWYLVAVRSKRSPLDQWPAFLSTYATLYIFNNVLRPVKLVVIGFVTPRIERSFTWMMNKFGIGRKRAVLFVYIMLNSLAVLLMAVSVLAASCLAGVSIWWGPALVEAQIRRLFFFSRLKKQIDTKMQSCGSSRMCGIRLSARSA